MSRASRSSTAGASQAPVTPSRPMHRRQWTHSNLDGSKNVRIHRSPARTDAGAAAAVAEGDEQEEEEEEQKEEEKEEVNEDGSASDASDAAAAPARSRRQPAASARRAQPQRPSKRHAAAAAAASTDDDDDSNADDDDAEMAFGQGSGNVAEDNEQGGEAAESSSASESGSESEAEDEDDDAWVSQMAGWAASELTRRLKAPHAASAAAAASSADAKAKPAAAAAAGAAASDVVASRTQLDNLFTSRPRGSAAAATAVPHGFVRKSGVLHLAADAEEEAIDAADSSKAHAHAPDLLASLGSRSAATPLPSSNPLAASKSARSGQVKTAGSDWFNMSRPSAMTAELKADLKLLSLRAYLDPKKFFKKESASRRKKIVPAFFQMGTVIAGAQEFYSGRLTHAERSQHYADEFIDPSKNVGATKKTKHYLKRKVMELQKQNAPAPRHFNKKRKMMEEHSKRGGSAKKGRK